MMMVEPQIMRRTRSMSGGMSVEVMAESDDHDVNVMRAMHMGGEGGGEGEKSVMNWKGMVSSTSHSRSPTTCKAIDTTPHFLRTCCLCKRHLAPARDIYMYRGDTAFCSLECREEHMKVEERKDKCKMSSNSNYKKQDHHASSSNSNSNPNSKPSTSTIAAA